MFVDAHFHSWQLSRADYGWLTPALGSIYRDVAVPDWQQQAHGCHVSGGVLVQAAPTEAETWHLLALADAHPCVLGVVGWADFLAPDAPDRIRQLATHPKLKGLRPMLQDIADPQWILQPALQLSLTLMAELGLVLDALVTPRHLPALLQLAVWHPHLQVVIDHAAKPAIHQNGWQPWADQMTQLASYPQISCKLSGLLTEAGPHPAPDAARRWASHVLDTFGDARVLWGSDWPVLELASSYSAWWQECQDLLGPEPLRRNAIFGGNARRVYRLAPRR